MMSFFAVCLFVWLAWNQQPDHYNTSFDFLPWDWRLLKRVSCPISCIQPHPDWSIPQEVESQWGLHLHRGWRGKMLSQTSCITHPWQAICSSLTFCASKGRNSSSKQAKAPQLPPPPPPATPTLKPDQQGNILQPFIHPTNSSETSVRVQLSAIATSAADERKPLPLILRTGNETMAETNLSHIETIAAATVRNALWMVPLLSRHS